MLTSFIIAFVILALAVLGAFLRNRIRPQERAILNVTHILIIGTFAALLALHFPIYWDEYKREFVLSQVWKTVLSSAFQAIRAFLAEGDLDLIREAVRGQSSTFSMWYTGLAIALFVAAPILTFDFLLSFFKNLSSYRRLLKKYFCELYVFSELNEKSLALAESIAKKSKRNAIVFTDVFSKNEEESFELIKQANELGAILFKKDIVSVNFNLHSKRKKLAFFTIGINESENVNQAFSLIKHYRERENTMLYVFSTSVDSELILSAADKGEVKVRRIKDVRSLIYRTLYDMEELAIRRAAGSEENQRPDLFASAKLMEDGSKHIGAVVIGCGLHGTEMVKALSWFCQMDGYRLSIDVFDKDAQRKSKFTALCPELMDKRYNREQSSSEEEAQYHITFHDGMEVDTVEFADAIKKLTDTTYVFIALGTDEENIKAAITLRTLFEQIKVKPVIQAVVYNSEKKNSLQNLKNFKGQAYNIDFVGDLETLYSEEVIIDSELEQAALRVHLGYDSEGEEDFWNYEYNYRSSMATALHIEARIACGIPGADKHEEELTPEERDSLERLEHRRWNAYMRSEGYIYSGSEDKASRNDLAKMHHNLVHYDILSEEDKRKDSRVGTK